MKVAVIGGGIAGVSTAYELARSGIEFKLYEASHRLGGIVETVRRDGFVVECGPDSWVTEKPWARDLALELGLEDEIIPSNDHLRKTYIARDEQLIAMPDGLRMMVPTQWEPLLGSPLFSEEARRAYQQEPGRAEELKTTAPDEDESVASFVRRHFGDEVTNTIAAPLLAGVFGGNIDLLSARAVMPAFVKMEREHGSLITALQRNASGGESAPLLTNLPDEEVIALARNQLASLMGSLPEPSFVVIRRWPRSLPQYAVGHLQRMELLQQRVRTFTGLQLTGNAYYGVGLPDLINLGRKAASQLMHL
jgi:oxygen-dependent protoporphyrinogen oxidase